MNLTQAKAAMLKLWGTRYHYRYDERAPKAEEREALLAAMPALKDAHEHARLAQINRQRELLADPEYQRLCDAAKIARDELDAAQIRARHYRVAIGYRTDLAFHVEAVGNNWQETIDAARDAKANK